MTYPALSVTPIDKGAKIMDDMSGHVIGPGVISRWHVAESSESLKDATCQSINGPVTGPGLHRADGAGGETFRGRASTGRKACSAFSHAPCPRSGF